MAEESIDLLVIPDRIEFDGKVSENGDGDADSLDDEDATDDQFRRASISSATFSESVNSEKPLPNYLRASTGSCHDFCKFGRKHADEEKIRRPERRNLKSLRNQPEFLQIFVPGEIKKEKVVRQKSSVDTTSNRSRVSKSSDMKSHSLTPKSTKVIKPKQSHDLKHSPDEMKISPTLKVKETKLFKKRSPVVPDNRSPELKPPSDPKLRLSKSKSLGTGAHSLDRNGLSANNTRLSTSKPLLMKKSPSPVHPEILKRDVKLSAIKTKVGGETSSSANVKVSRLDRNTEKVSSSKAKAYKINPLSSSGSSTSGLNRGEGKVVRKNPLASSAASLSSSPSFSKTPASKQRKDGNPLKNKSKSQMAGTKSSDSEKIPEKTLHVIKTETENSSFKLNDLKSNDNVVPSISSPSPHGSSSECTVSNPSEGAGYQEAVYNDEDSDEISCEDKEIMEIGEVEHVNENTKKILRKSKMVDSEVKHHSPVKLKFRSGKVVDLHTEDNTPRRLKFRKARILEADRSRGDLTLSKRTFEKVGDNENAEEVSPEKVSLKHQDVQQEKKGEQGLLNNVIEETATKLAESRKSKVKALVGAFETVFSRQDSISASSNAAN